MYSVRVGIRWIYINLMFLSNLQERLKGRRKRKERVNEEEEEKAKILKYTYNILDCRDYQ